jgi:hypothetical protein
MRFKFVFSSTLVRNKHASSADECSRSRLACSLSGMDAFFVQLYNFACIALEPVLPIELHESKLRYEHSNAALALAPVQRCRWQ